MQTYGEAKMDANEMMKAADAEVSLAQESIKAREEVTLFRDALATFRKTLKDAMDSEDPTKRPTRYVFGKLEPVSDLDILNAMRDAATTLNKLNIDGLKLDDTKYLLVDHVIASERGAYQAAERAVMKTEELIVAKQVRGEEIETDAPVRDYVLGIYKKERAAEWLRLKQKIGRG